MLSHYFYYRVFLAPVLFNSSYPLNPTQNHLVNSTLLIFNLSTQPSISLVCKHPKTKKSESRKRTPNSRKCLVFKPFSVFTSVLLTSILRTQQYYQSPTNNIINHPLDLSNHEYLFQFFLYPFSPILHYAL